MVLLKLHLIHEINNSLGDSFEKQRKNYYILSGIIEEIVYSAAILRTKIIFHYHNRFRLSIYTGQNPTIKK
jgi:hypothetical protein